MHVGKNTELTFNIISMVHVSSQTAHASYMHNWKSNYDKWDVEVLYTLGLTFKKTEITWSDGSGIESNNKLNV